MRDRDDANRRVGWQIDQAVRKPGNGSCSHDQVGRQIRDRCRGSWPSPNDGETVIDGIEELESQACALMLVP
jgi:hypothetical protein